MLITLDCLCASFYLSIWSPVDMSIDLLYYACTIPHDSWHIQYISFLLVAPIHYHSFWNSNISRNSWAGDWRQHSRNRIASAKCVCRGHSYGFIAILNGQPQALQELMNPSAFKVQLVVKDSQAWWTTNYNENGITIRIRGLTITINAFDSLLINLRKSSLTQRATVNESAAQATRLGNLRHQFPRGGPSIEICDWSSYNGVIVDKWHYVHYCLNWSSKMMDHQNIVTFITLWLVQSH